MMVTKDLSYLLFLECSEIFFESLSDIHPDISNHENLNIKISNFNKKHNCAKNKPQKKVSKTKINP